MRAGSLARRFIADIIAFLSDNKEQLVYTILFLLLMGGGSIQFPVLRPIVTAAFFVLPLHLIVRFPTDFDERDYQQFSPIFQNIDDIRFLLITFPLLGLPILSWYLDSGFGWEGYGTIGLFMITSSVGAFIWSEGLYMKNYYFGRWHIIERGLLILSGILSILFGPVFVPLFLFSHRVITHQFDYPDIGGFMGTHSRLPWTVLLIGSSFAFVRLFLPVQPSQITLLLLCGYSAHYFHPGLAKLVTNGPLFYIRNNNPIYMFLNAHAVGWLNSIKEETVVDIGKLSNNIKPLLNVFVVSVELGTILLLLSSRLSIIIVSLTIILHLAILLTTGVNFWKWVFVDLFLIVGIVFAEGQTLSIFGGPEWVIGFTIFVVFAECWMNPVGMDWLDAPYIEYLQFKGERADGEIVTIHPNVFRPYDVTIAQGSTGAFTFLGKHPRIQYCLGAVNQPENKDMHSFLVKFLNESPPNSDESSRLVRDIGVELYDENKTQEMRRIINRFLKRSDGRITKVLRLLSSPREFYTDGFGHDNYKYVAEYKSVKLYRVDGIWTEDGFQELNREKVISIQT